jgi:pyrroline-5-carboxylate reductase
MDSGTQNPRQEDFSPIAILGGGNIGTAIARGLVASGKCSPQSITITRRDLTPIQSLGDLGVRLISDNVQAVRDAKIIILAVRPLQLSSLIEGIKEVLDSSHHLVLSVASGVSIEETSRLIGTKIPVVRVMPSTAIAVRESMTCLAAKAEHKEALEISKNIFSALGKTQVIEEEFFSSATSLCACGTAFFLRAIRAASQGGIEIGFHSEEAIMMAAQTARGAASLLLQTKTHPEEQIDKVTTPRGCTIAGLNRMEHEGFSSALIKGIVTSAKIADELYIKEEDK